MDNAGEKLAGDLVHIGDHQEQTLRSRVGSSKRACGKGAVNSTGSACLGLHFSYFYRLTEQVVLLFRGPLVGDLSHYRGRGDRVDSSNVGKGIRDPRRSVVAVHGLFFSCHFGQSS